MKPFQGAMRSALAVGTVHGDCVHTTLWSACGTETTKQMAGELCWLLVEHGTWSTGPKGTFYLPQQRLWQEKLSIVRHSIVPIKKPGPIPTGMHLSAKQRAKLLEASKRSTVSGKPPPQSQLGHDGAMEDDQKDSGSEGDGANAEVQAASKVHATFMEMHTALRQRPLGDGVAMQTLARLRTQVATVRARQPAGLRWQTVLEDSERNPPPVWGKGQARAERQE